MSIVDEHDNDDLPEINDEKIRAAIAYQSQLDYFEAGPKTPYSSTLYKGVLLTSRYDVLSEYNHMKRVLDNIPELMARRIESIWCDSKGQAFYTVTIDSKLFLDILPELINKAFINCGGYNGISIECDGRVIPYFDSYWPGDYD